MATEAVEYSLANYDIPVAPTLPRRSPAEGMIAQALLGIEGVTLGQYGSIAVDVRRLDPCAPVVTDLHHDGFTGIRTFLDVAAARGYQGPVKWQFVGPVTLGVALTAGRGPRRDIVRRRGPGRPHPSARDRRRRRRGVARLTPDRAA